MKTKKKQKQTIFRVGYGSGSLFRGLVLMSLNYKNKKERRQNGNSIQTEQKYELNMLILLLPSRGIYLKAG